MNSRRASVCQLASDPALMCWTSITAMVPVTGNAPTCTDYRKPACTNHRAAVGTFCSCTRPACGTAHRRRAWPAASTSAAKVDTLSIHRQSVIASYPTRRSRTGQIGC